MKRITLSYLVKQNLKRRLYRTSIIILLVGLATGTLFSASLLTGGVERSLKLGTARLGAEVLVVPQGTEVSAETVLLIGKPSTFYMDRSVEQKVKAVPGVAQTSYQIFMASLFQAACCSEYFQLIGIDPTNDFTITPWLREHPTKPLGLSEIIVGARIFQEVGEYLMFFGRVFEIVGKLEETGMGIDTCVFMSFDAAFVMAAESETKALQKLEVKPGQISTILVKVNPEVSPGRVASEIEALVPGVTAITAAQLSLSISGQLLGVLQSLFVLSGTVWVMSILMVGAIFSMIINERRREIGLLRAIGATRRFIFKLVMFEASLLTAIGGTLGVIAGGAIIYLFITLITSTLRVPYLWPTLIHIGSLVGLCVALGVLTGVVGAVYPATASSRMDPYLAVRTGE